MTATAGDEKCGEEGALPAAAAEALHRHEELAEALHHRVELEEGELGSSAAYLDPPAPAADAPLRDKLNHLIHSHKYQWVVVGLVLLDCVCVITELLIDLEATQNETANTVKEVLHNVSIAILSVFLLEIVLKLWVLRLQYLRMPWEMFDAVVVIVSFALDVAFRHSVGPVNGAGLIILLRLWRVTRIASGMVMSVRRHAEHRLEVEKERRLQLARELAAERAYSAALEGVLRQHALPLPPRPQPDPHSTNGGSGASHHTSK